MVVRKAGGPNVTKKKNIEEAKKLAEKKKIMLKEEESEDEDMSEEESDDDDDMSEIEEGSEESDDSEEDDEESDDDDDDDSLDEEEETKKPNKSKDLGQSFADKSMNSKSPVKSANKTPAKTPNKLTVQQNSQKKQIENKTSKTPKQQNILQQSKSDFSPSPKKNDDNLKTPASLKQSKAAGSVKRKAIEMVEDDDDDDDEEDDDDDEEEDEEDDDEEEEDDDEEEEEDEEDEKEAPKLVKSVEPPAKRAKNDVPQIDLKSSEEQRRKERDIRSLFIRGFPEDTTEEDVKALSSDIISVRLPANKKRKRPGMKGGVYAFVEFKSEKIAEENFSILEKKKIKGRELFIDFVGAKSKNKAFVDRTKERDLRNVNKQKLFVSNIPSEASMEDFGKAFPAAVSLYLSSGANRTAQISFDSEDAAAEAFKKNSSLKIKGTPVVVLYALINKHRKGKGSGRGKPSPRKPFQHGQGFRKSFNEQRKPFKHSFGNEDDDE